MFKFFTLIFVFGIAFSNAIADVGDHESQFVPVTTYTTKDGLPSSNIQDIVQDEEGFIWLGTQEGLSRFDSFEFQNFTKDKSDDNSLPDILVEDLILMPDGELWMSIYEVGISVFDKFTHKSTSIKNTKSNLFQLPNSNLYGIAKDKDNNIWFSLYGEGIYQWKVLENKFYKHLSSDKNAWLTSKLTFEIMVDSKNRLWVCTIDSKVYYYDINTGESKYFNFSSDVNDPLSSPIYGFAESGQGEIYAGGFSGVFKYDESSRSFNSIVSKPLISSFYGGDRTSVRRLMIDSNENLWIGTTKSLLKLTNNQLNKIQFYENGEILDTPNLTIHSIIEGDDGNIWIGTEGLGLVKIAADWNRYKIYISQDKEPIDIRRAFLYEDQIWVVHTSSKIDLLELKNGNIQLKSSLDPHLSDDIIRFEDIYQDSPDILWLSSVNGINKVNNLSGEISMVVNESGRMLGSVPLFHRAQNRKFYFNFFGSSTIGYFDEVEMVAHEIVNTEDNHFSGNVVNQIIEGLDGKLWFVSDYGIETLNIENQTFGVVFKANKELTITNIYFAENRRDVWMIADGGLFHLIWNNGELSLQENKYQLILPLVKFGKIKNLDKNILLITTEGHGLVEINIENLDYKVYTTENGLPSDVIQNVLFPNGIPLVVTESGVALYNQQFEAKAQEKPTIVFDTIELAGTKLPTNTKNLLLEHDYGTLYFDLALLSFTNSSSFEYEYMLDGVSRTWIDADSTDKYSFFNIRANDYNFKVRGRSNYGPWSDAKEFSFTVKPAPWKTLWAYALYALGVLGVFYWFLYIYKRKILYEHEITKQQAQKHLANASSKAKSDFLARVSHEVRTPLNGVLGMGELMLDTRMDEEQQIYTESIMASGRHLLDIINDILDLSKIEAGKMELESEPFNLLYLVDEIVGAFASQAKEKELLFTCHFESKLEVHRIGDVIRIKQILFNLLSNAFKFTKRGQIKLQISSAKSNIDYVVFSIKDTGTGVDDKTIEDLFKPFVQADSAITRKFGGTGLGLAIVKQLTEKMDGQINVKGIVDVGSKFTVGLALKSDTMTQEKTLVIPDSKEFCLALQDKDLQDSLHHYFKRLNIQYTSQINESTQCLLVDVLSTLSDNQIKSINKAVEEKIDIVFIGFDLKAVNNIASLKNIPIKLLSPPVTYKKLQQICNDPEISYEKTEVLQETAIQKTLNLLVVEDNAINQQVSIEMLEKMGHWVDIIDSAEEALIMLNRSKYDLLLVDYHLPGMDGLSMVKVWDNINHVPVIVVTADLTDELYSRCNKLGITNIVAKPFTQRVLSEAIAKAIENSQQI